MKNRLLLLLMGVFCLSNASFAQTADWRNARNGDPIYTNGYCDQPYVVVLPDGKWLCVFTTNQNQEGAKGQHIVSTVSADQGQTGPSRCGSRNPVPNRPRGRCPM